MFQRFFIRQEEWSTENTSDMRVLVQHPLWNLVPKLIHRRISALTEDLVNGKETRPQISELRDLLLELKNYADSR